MTLKSQEATSVSEKTDLRPSIQFREFDRKKKELQGARAQCGAAVEATITLYAEGPKEQRMFSSHQTGLGATEAGPIERKDISQGHSRTRRQPEQRSNLFLCPSRL